ncbi:hypothetical protein H0H87_007667 [Tephrocybe sp. NHM501043]|nr:hypothetical protein H0H87_007667 [Tephrocybe sp. NHM501043]
MFLTNQPRDQQDLWAIARTSASMKLAATKNVGSLQMASSSSTSLYSSVTSSTAVTSSSSSTVPGPGALSGKAILALGKVTLRGAEFIIIRRRLKVIESKFPILNSANVKGIEGMPSLYSDGIRRRALQILLVQIANRQTWHIVKCLGKWPEVEVELFLSNLMTIFDPIRISQENAKNETSIKAYKNALPTWEGHSLASVVDFLIQLVESHHPSTTAMFTAGILDLLLHMYATNFRDPLAETERVAIQRTTTLFTACGNLLRILYSTQSGIQTILNHPLRALWPTRPEQPFTIPRGVERAQKRLEAWVNASKTVLQWRTYTTFDMMQDHTRSIDDSVMYDICADLLEIAGCEIMDVEIQMRALRLLGRVFKRATVVAQNIIREYLLLRSIEHSTKLVSRIIKKLSCVMCVKLYFSPITYLICGVFRSLDTLESEFFYLPGDHQNFYVNAVTHFIHLFVNLSKQNETVREIILAADVLGLMRPFLELELRGSRHRIAVHEGDMLTVYDPPDFDLLALIKARGLKELLPAIQWGEKSYALTYRSFLMCRAFNVFLGRGDNWQASPEFWIVDWDDSPSGLDESDNVALWITS